MSGEHVLALDAGTTSVRAIVFDADGNPVSVGQEEFSQYFPEPGWVEHDAVEIWEKQRDVAAGALAEAGLSAGDIAGIGITNQRETTVVWDRKSGEPIHNAIVWQDRRTAEECDALRARGLEALVGDRTGLVIDAFFSGTKIAWLLDRVPGARERALRGELAFGTVDTWLIWNLTGGAAHVTDVTNASRSMLFDIRDLDWNDTLLNEIRVPRAVLPQVRNSSEVYGTTRAELFGAEIPVAAAVGDQQGALFGQACFRQGMAKCTYGTAATLMMNTGSEVVRPDGGLISTVAVGIDDAVQYAVEGMIFNCGTAVQWLRDGLRLIESSSDAVCEAPDTGGVYFVPAFTGTSAPTWDPYARGAVVGLTRGTTRENLIRATLESMVYQVNDVVRAVHAVSGFPLGSVKVDGGACRNDFVMQFQADISNLPVLRPTVTESTARGAAFLAGLATGVWRDREELADSFALDRQFDPAMDREEAERLYAGWQRATERALGWAESG